MIDKATIAKIIDRADIVEVVGDYVHLIKRGRNYMGLCPFHNERTPSFSVSPQRNFCYCFSCHQGGSPVNFIMAKEGLSYPDALRHLANKYGIKIEERELTDEERKAQSEREAMLVANEWSMRHWESRLRDTEEGRCVGLEYLYQRGITDAAIKAFHLGYALDKADDLSFNAKRAGHDLQTFYNLGLITKSSRDGRPYEPYHGRVIFPIFNSAGKVFGFGARDLQGKSPAKYINSPESALYHKGSELYGLYQAKNEMVRRDKCFLVEGYMDVIGMWQSGMQNVLASSGTALTDGQIALIHRFTDNVTLIYDGDAAGIKASLRGIDMLLAHKMKVKVLLLPDGHDPDSFARANTPEDFRRYVSEHETDFITFKTDIMLGAAKDPTQRAEAIRSIVASIAAIPDPIQRNVYIQECSSRLGISEELVASETLKARDKIKEARLKEARREEQKRELEKETPSPAVQQPVQPVETDKNPHPLQPFEKEVIRYCIRYGMLFFCEGYADDTGETVVNLNVAEYVQAELYSDNILFSTPVYQRIFDLILQARPEFESALEAMTPTFDSDKESFLAQGREKIANESNTMEAIAEAEKRLEEEAEQERQRAVETFTCEFIQRRLASDPDDEVRTAAIALMAEPYVLSRYHLQQPNVETERERLKDLLPRAMTEWRDGILKLRLEEVYAQLEQAQRDGDQKLTEKLMCESFEIMEMRRNAATHIGERIIVPF